MHKVNLKVSKELLPLVTNEKFDLGTYLLPLPSTTIEKF